MLTIHATIPVGQGRRKIILKLDAKILGKLFFQKKINTRKKRILENILEISIC
jgi:hypothetical protein